MELRIRDTGQVMMESEFRSLHPNTSFPQQLSVSLLNEFGADPVLNGAQPTATKYQTIVRDGVEEINGQWFTKFIAIDMDAESITALDEQQSTAQRTERNRKLGVCDWTQLADATVNKAAWATYRQSLRDVPSQSGFPWDITWPVEP